MDTQFDPPYVVYLRKEGGPPPAPDAVEPIEIPCDTFAQALQIRRTIQDPHLRCIIRYLGETGGGD
jgi:hypothetical protein